MLCDPRYDFVPLEARVLAKHRRCGVSGCRIYTPTDGVLSEGQQLRVSIAVLAIRNAHHRDVDRMKPQHFQLLQLHVHLGDCLGEVWCVGLWQLRAVILACEARGSATEHISVSP